jgi:hypothetical protein
VPHASASAATTSRPRRASPTNTASTTRCSPTPTVRWRARSGPSAPDRCGASGRPTWSTPDLTLLGSISSETDMEKHADEALELLRVPSGLTASTTPRDTPVTIDRDALGLEAVGVLGLDARARAGRSRSPPATTAASRRCAAGRGRRRGPPRGQASAATSPYVTTSPGAVRATTRTTRSAKAPLGSRRRPEETTGDHRLRAARRGRLEGRRGRGDPDGGRRGPRGLLGHRPVRPDREGRRGPQRGPRRRRDGRIGAIDGIETSETVIAFRSYSPRLLDEGFALGE